MFGHEKLDVYQCSLRFFSCSKSLESRVPPGLADLADQLRRAAVSIPLTIAEGAGKVGPRDKARFFAMARGSAGECSAILDVLVLVGGQDAKIAEAKELLDRIGAMLSKMYR